MAPPIQVLREGPLSRIVLNRPQARNALDLEALGLLITALQGVAEDESRVVVLTGAGQAFCAGGDIQDMVARRGKGVATFERLKAGLSTLVRLITEHPKPVLARVDGDAVGAGCALALACDFLISTQRSRFGFPFVKMGLVPDTGASWTVPHIVGIQQARRLLLTGDLVTAEEANGLGLLTQLVADEAALDAAVAAWVTKLVALPPTAIRDAKRQLWQSIHLPLSTALVNEAVLQGVRFTTDEHAKAVDAFLAKKKG